MQDGLILDGLALDGLVHDNDCSSQAQKGFSWPSLF